MEYRNNPARLKASFSSLALFLFFLLTISTLNTSKQNMKAQINFR